MAAVTFLAIAAICIWVLLWPLTAARRGVWSLAGSACLGAALLTCWHLLLRWDVYGMPARRALLPVFVAVLLTSIVLHRHRLAGAPAASRFLAAGLVAAVGTASILAAREVRRGESAEAVALAWPLGPGAHFVAQGGPSPLLNHHRAVPAQAEALDVTALGPGGRRANGLLPEELEAYAIYGTPVLAPCAGTVVAVADGHPPTPIGGSGRPLHGNAVVVACADGRATVLLAHLMSGLPVAEGDEVTIGHPLGLVGNSGNTTEPHLHVHAVAGRVEDPEEILFTGRGVPMAFDGRVLARNDVVEALDEG